MKKRRKSSAEKVKGQIFDVAFKKDSQELSAAKLRDQMKVIIQASMEEDEEKIRCLEKAPKLAWAQLSQDFSRSIEEDPDHIKPDSNPKKAPRVPKLKRNVVENCDAVAQTVSKKKLNLVPRSAKFILAALNLIDYIIVKAVPYKHSSM